MTFLIWFWLMQKLYWPFCVANLAFRKSLYICKLLITGHNCPVPVDNYKSDKMFSQSIDPLDEAEDKLN